MTPDLLKTSQWKKWEKTGINKRAGVLFPLFSVRSKKSSGIGDFEDLKLLIDFCAGTGNSILQLLPLNEMGSNFCPYDAISSFAIEPSYISVSVDNISEKIESWTDFAIKEKKIKRLKTDFESGTWDTNSEFQKFIEENSYWIYDFALYKTLKDFFKNKPWYQWEKEYVEKDPHTLNQFRKIHAKEMFFYMWVQWQSYKQLRKAKKYAEEKGVLIMGDMPVLVSGDSADVWTWRNYFKTQYAAGAPPDMYSQKGQRWGMPPNNWEIIGKDNYRYLKERLRYAENFYDIIRIDHVVGLFRLWSIPFMEPVENAGLKGFFDPGDETLWEEHGRKTLNIMLENTDMLFCAEDLGVIPPFCPKVLEEMGIPGTDVFRWKKHWETTGGFLKPEEYRAIGISTLSTHDTTDWNSWWENEAEKDEKEKIWKEFKMAGKPKDKSDKKLLGAALKYNFSANSIFSIQSIFDLLELSDILKKTSLKCRINTPGTISNKNWTIVVPVYVEDLLKNPVCEEIKGLIKASNRLNTQVEWYLK
ncbi:MAG: 4-alpha-glucanotransferase [Candidatus Omnitrophica bacterium]|nr:4-alpha-glucanotransferase [Candidatus Omnitrophota bacterium]